MSKVLISFLGTSFANRQYREASYQFEDGSIITTSFIAKALAEHYGIDQIILVGTVKSMWEEVYRVFAQEKGILDDDKYLEIADTCDHADHTSELFIPHQPDIEKALGKGSKIILIKYGLNQEEIEFNSSQILSIEKLLHTGDRLVVDITHSFRSLPMILMNVLIYLQNVSIEKISIERITYGMLDVTKEMNGMTPVVDLSNLLKLSDWISGAYAFQQFGNAYKIAELMRTEDPSVAERLKRFSDLLNLNHIASIRDEAQNLSAIKNQHYSSKIPEMVLNPILKDFINEFSNATTDSSFQFRLAQWQFEHHNYCPAFLTLQESIITYVCEQSGYDSNDYDNREEVKKKISEGDGVDDTLRKTFKSIKNIRNSLAHSRKSGQSYIQMIKTLQDSINILKNIIP